ncbi:DUF6896 domain-containing protein [Flavobacterium sp. HTF]|uniref:DUF6896 domain-containing protein n=1 Tax=Flavobacterium sp. HTF TaxID=2170732 RepID=UPI000D5DB507|nr:hypothetical protein [Flavobacterium sp. HTF]PWB22985.1 hypothetical protein DCO46_15695 [Flavobacterium sp. HTF]
MNSLPQEIINELLIAMDSYNAIAKILIDKLITETDQPEKEKINEGHYYEIENADLFNGKDTLSEGWSFNVHGEHCLFDHIVTGQSLEVSLGNKENITNLDPYFFYLFLKTTPGLQHLTEYFKNPFSDMLTFFEILEEENIVINVYGNEFRKV